MSFQYPLDFRLHDEATLERFVIGTNGELLNYVDQLASNDLCMQIYICGQPGTGKTHLLQAITRIIQDAMYIPLASIKPFVPDIFEGLENRRLLCIDDVDDLAGEHAMEVALFSLMKQVNENRCSIILASHALPGGSGFGLDDLISRLNGCIRYQLQPLGESDMREYINADFVRRGMEVGGDVVDWMLTHLPRDIKSLSELMNRLDIESLRKQRRITVPFIKELL